MKEVYIPKNFGWAAKGIVSLNTKPFEAHFFLLRVIDSNLYGCRSHSNELRNSIFLYIVYCLVCEEQFFPCFDGCDYETRRI